MSISRVPPPPPPRAIPPNLAFSFPASLCSDTLPHLFVRPQLQGISETENPSATARGMLQERQGVSDRQADAAEEDVPQEQATPAHAGPPGRQHQVSTDIAQSLPCTVQKGHVGANAHPHHSLDGSGEDQLGHHCLHLICQQEAGGRERCGWTA